MQHRVGLVTAILGCLLSGSGTGPASSAAVTRVAADLEYARAGDRALALDLYRPVQPPRAPLIIWVHGGAWRSGSRKQMPLAGLLERGFAVASVDYRLTPVASFPAQLHDLKAAIRYLRAKQMELGISAGTIAIAGASAGGHLAALVGVTNGHAELEGDVGEHRDQSSNVQAIISLYGMSNLTTILAQSTPHGLSVRVPALQLLLGGQPEEKPQLARLASPVFHVDAQDPPLLLIHGDQDPQAPINQAHELEGRYRAVKRPCRLVVMHGAAHGGDEFTDAARCDLMADFLRTTAK